jgi:hypothetical protein
MREEKAEQATKTPGSLGGIDSFAMPIGTGMHRVARHTEPDASSEHLLALLDAFAAVRNRGAVESRFAYLTRPRSSH